MAVVILLPRKYINPPHIKYDNIRENGIIPRFWINPRPTLPLAQHFAVSYNKFENVRLGEG